MHPTSTASVSKARLLLAVAAGILAMFLYGGQFVVSRFSLQQTLSPWDLAALRFGVAGLLSLPFLIRRGLRSAGGIGWRRSLVLAITAGAPYTLILYMGLAVAPAAHGAVIIPGATPLFAAAFAWVWLGEETAPRAIVGLGLILVGLVAVSWPGITGPPATRRGRATSCSSPRPCCGRSTRWWSGAGRSVRLGPSSWCGCWPCRTCRSTGRWMEARG